MQNDQISAFNDGEQSVSLRDQKLIDYLEDLWKRPSDLSPESLKHIVKFLTFLPDPQKALGMTKIAEHLVNTLSLHFLDLLATFKEKAEDEGIDKEESIETLRGAVLELFPEMMGMSKHIFVRSIDDLITLGNITLSLYTLSQVNSAEDAQSWIYELPTLYWHQLAQERLVTNFQAQGTVTQSPAGISSSGFISWKSSFPEPVKSIPTVTTKFSTSPKFT